MEPWKPPKTCGPTPSGPIDAGGDFSETLPESPRSPKKVEFRLGKGPTLKERSPLSGPLGRGLEAQGSKALGKTISRAEGAVFEPVDRDDRNQVLETTFFPPPSSWNCSELLMGFPCDFSDICYKICRGLRPEEVHTKCPVHLRLLGSKSANLALSCLV
jgi:hypothetical protein